MENPERNCRAQCNGYHQERCKWSRVTRECYIDRCFRIYINGSRRKQTQPSTLEPNTTPQITDQQLVMIATQNLTYNRPLSTNSLIHPSPYAISHHPSYYRSTVPQSPTTRCHASTHLKHLHTQPKRTILAEVG